MSKNKSFFQKLSDSFSSIFPFNSTTREDISNVSFDRNLSPITHSNRRLASEAFGRDDEELKVKRARLHYDLKSLPTSRIIKPITSHLADRYNAYNNNFNDAASDFSDTSNISVSTSGVSSLHPRSSKRFNLGLVDDFPIQNSYKYPRNLNVSQKPNSSISQMSIKHTKDFISSPAKKILEKLDKLTTPITAGDKLASLLIRERAPINNINRLKASNPYSRSTPPIGRKKPIPIKAVTVSATSKDLSTSNCGPIRSKNNQKRKPIGFSDDVDLDSESIVDEYKYPILNDSVKINFSNIPMLKKSVSTNTDDAYFVNSDEEEAPGLEFSFRPPQTINDDDYLHNLQKQTISYEFKSKIDKNEMNNDHQNRLGSKNISAAGSWKCSTCFSNNKNESLECRHCENISNKNVVVISEKAIPTSFDKTNLLKTLLENETTSTGFTISNDTNITVSTACFALAQTPANLSNADSKLSIFNSNNESVKISSFGLSSAVSSSTFTFGQLPVTVSKTESISFSSSNPISIGQSSLEISKTFAVISNSTVSTPVALSTDKKSDIVVSSAIVSTSSNTFSFGQTSTAFISKPPSFGLVSSSGVMSTSVVSTSPFVFGQISCSDSVAPIVASDSSKPFSIDAKTNIDTSKPLTFGQQTSNIGILPLSLGGVSTTGLYSSSSASTGFEASKPLSFGNISTSFEASKPLSFGNISTSFEASKPLSFGNISTTGSFQCGTISTSAETSKPFTFEKTSNSQSPSMTSSVPFSLNQKTNIETPKTFKFGQPSAVADSKPFSFDQKTSVEEPKPFSFGAINSKPFSANFEVSKSTAFGQVSNTSESKSFSNITDAKPFTFGQLSSTAVTSSSNLFGSSKPFSIDQKCNSESQKPLVFGLQQTPTVTEASAPKLFQSVSSTPSIFGAINVTEKSSFNFGEPKTTTSDISTKSNLFGNSSSSNTSSGFVFGQQTNMSSTATSVTGSFTFNNPLQKSDSSSSLFRDSQKSAPSAAAQSLFGSNGTNNSTSNLFGAPQIGSNPSIANDSLKPTNAFMFTPQSSSLATASVGNSIGTGFAFNNPITTSASSTMNFGQPASIGAPFTLTNNVSQSNMFSAVAPQSSQFTFGASSSNNNPSISNSGSVNVFGSSTGTAPPAAPAFSFTSAQPVFQFGGNINATAQPNNMSNSSLPASNNSRRLLKVRRNRK